MSSLLDHYRVLGVSVGAGISDVTSSYKRLCRMYHPDVSDDPESEEMMKRINIAYTVLREKLRREAAFRERQSYTRTARKYGNADAYTYTAGYRATNTNPRGSDTNAHTANPRGADTNTHTANPRGADTNAHTANPRAQADARANTRTYATDARAKDAEAEKEAYTVLQNYFKALSACNYTGAYTYLSSYDRKHISRESFIDWRKSVARVFPMNEFIIKGGMSGATINFNDGKSRNARRFHVSVTEEDIAKDATLSDDVEKLVIYENGLWKVFLGYSGVGELTREFDEQFEIKLKKDVAKRWEEYYAGLHPEYNMLSLTGMRKAASRELYRQQRFGGTLTFAAISVQCDNQRGPGQEQLLRYAAKTMTGALRETDIPAYAGDGVFAILLVELRKKNADEIISRLIEKIRRNAGPQLGAKANIEYTYGSWSGSGSADMEALNRILKKFRKKI
jgi:curved DNA-binding protein CbpA